MARSEAVVTNQSAVVRTTRCSLTTSGNAVDRGIRGGVSLKLHNRHNEGPFIHTNIDGSNLVPSQIESVHTCLDRSQFLFKRTFTFQISFDLDRSQIHRLTH